MTRNPLRRWLRSYLSPRRDGVRTADVRKPKRTNLGVERFEDRSLPSVSIPLNGQTWTPLGPAPILSGFSAGGLFSTGRVNGIAADPTNVNRIFVNTSNGGIWRTLDGGATWKPLIDNLSPPNPTYNLDMGGIAMSKTDPNVLYAGTGDPYSFTSGSGIYKTTDGGNTWTLLGQTAFAGSSIHSIVISPTDPNVVFASAYNPFGGFFGFGGASGIFRSLDGGTTWTNITASAPLISPAALTPGSGFYDVDVDPNNLNILYASVGNPSGAVENGIYKSTDALSASPTFNVALGGSTLLPGSLPGTVDLTISPTQPSTLYVQFGERGDPNNAGRSGLLGVYQSTDSGANWLKILDPSVHDDMGGTGGQAFFTNTISVDPLNPHVVYIAGTGTVAGPNSNQANNHIFVTTNAAIAGQTPVWTDISVGAGGAGPHTDSHVTTFDANDNLLLGSDGGIFKYTGGPLGGTWTALNGTPNTPGAGPNTLNTTLQIGIALHPRDANRVIAGAQDNGETMFVDDPTNANNNPYGWNVVDGGDGGKPIWDYDDPNIVLHQSPNTTVSRSTDGGLTFVPSAGGISGRPLFYAPIYEDPSRSQRFFFGTDDLFISENAGASWGHGYRFSPTITINVPSTPNANQPPSNGGPYPIFAGAVGRTGDVSNLPVLFVIQPGMDSNKVFHTMFRITLLPPPATLMTTSWIGFDPTDPTTGAVDFSAEYMTVDPTTTNVFYVYCSSGQVFQGTLDPFAPGGVDWRNLTGNLTAGPPESDGAVTNLALDPQVVTVGNDDDLYVGTNNGIWVLHNPNGNNLTWTRVGGNSLPNVSVDDVELNTTTGILAAGTFGRGSWEIQVRGLVQGYKYEDLNGNGVRNAGEPGIGGITIRLLDADNNDAEVATTVTDSTGHYEFRSIRPGHYDVRELTPAAYIQTSLDSATLTGTGPGGTFGEQDQANIDFGNFRRTSISGTKYNDLNGNGKLDAGDTGVAGVTIELRNSATNALYTTTTTDSAGHYSFNNLGPIEQVTGTTITVIPYKVDEVVPAASLQTGPTPNFYTITLISNTPSTGNDFFNFKLVTITGHKYEDLNGNGVRDSGEPPLPGFTFDLTNTATNTIVQTAVSGATGDYSFTGIGPGTFQITERPVAGFLQSSSPLPAIATQSGQNVTNQDFGNFRKVSISGHKFNDLNGNSTLDAGEPGLSGWTIELVDSANPTTVVASTTTDASGFYHFDNLAPLHSGSPTGPIVPYRVVEVLQTGWTQTGPTPKFYDVLVTSGNDVTGKDFLNFQLVSIAGTKFNDINGNGTLDPLDVGLSGFTIQLIDKASGTVIATQVTDNNGRYTFTNVAPGTYQLREVQQTGFVQTSPNPADVTPTSGGVITGQDFGNFKLVNLTGEAYRDLNSNGVEDAGEGRIPGFTIQLFNNATGALLATTTTDASGRYTFQSIGPGSFRLTEAPPRTWLTTQPRGGSYVFSTQSGSDFISANFGNVRSSVTVFGAGPGAGVVSLRSADTSKVLMNFFPYGRTFTGGVHVASGYIGGTRTGEYFVTAPAGGLPPLVKVFNSAGQLIRQFNAYSSSFTGGVFVATGDVNGDGFDDVITGSGAGIGSDVIAWDGRTGVKIREFSPFPGFTGGVTVAAADVNGDGKADIVAGAGPGGGPAVGIYSGTTLKRLGQFYAYNPSFTGGVFVAAGDFLGTGKAQILTGAGALIGGSPHAEIFDQTGLLLQSFFPYDPGFTGGVRVAAVDINGDGKLDIMTGPGSGTTPFAQSFSAQTLGRFSAFNAFDPSFLGGIFVG